MSLAAAAADPASAPPNRWLIAAAAFCMQLVLGSVYGWSVLLDPLAELHGATRGEVGLTFTVTLAVLGITAGFGGSLPQSLRTAGRGDGRRAPVRGGHDAVRRRFRRPRAVSHRTACWAASGSGSATSSRWPC